MYVFGQKSVDFLDNIHPNSPNSQFDFVLLVTSTDSFSELRKYFLDRKKVLKSLEANSFISPENVGAGTVVGPNNTF